VAVNVNSVLPMVLARGRTQEDLRECIDEYAKLDVWMVNDSKTIIRFIQPDDDE